VIYYVTKSGLPGIFFDINSLFISVDGILRMHQYGMLYGEYLEIPCKDLQTIAWNYNESVHPTEYQDTMQMVDKVIKRALELAK
jgi:hypothetical protein